jgi:hypothetical protein
LAVIHLLDCNVTFGHVIYANIINKGVDIP